MPFLTRADINSIVADDDLTVITDNDTTKVDSAIKAAIAEAQGYMDLYDTDALFAFEADERDFFLLEICKALAVYYICKACAANQNITDLKEGAHEARANLDKIQRGRLKPPGWPLKSDPQKSTYFHVSSNPKRGNHF